MARIYVGNLPMDVREKDIEDVFYKYGRIRDIDLKTPARPPAFAFVAFEDVRDAEDAVRGRDGYEMDGNRLRVELARGGRAGERGAPRGGGMPMGGGRQTEHRVIVTGLPPSASWQDLKDHMRKAGDVVYTDVDHRGGGIVHYGTRDDMEYALRKLDESEFRNPFDRSYIRVLPHRGAPRRDSRSRSRSPARRGGSSGGRGGKRYSSSRSRSRSRSRSPRGRGGRSRSRSPSSRSRSRSPKDRKDSDVAPASGDKMDVATKPEAVGAEANGADVGNDGEE